jgi:NADPH:quinone reductase-like Zn-dependent oxidoreductase
MELKKFIFKNLGKIKVKKNSKVLITGCSGFIAKYLIQVLLDILQQKFYFF